MKTTKSNKDVTEMIQFARWFFKPMSEKFLISVTFSSDTEKGKGSVNFNGLILPMLAIARKYVHGDNM